jgi:hypothetical protein|tara:strand:+ start:592 stop:759 length:168 start_codon:yes stop_codon:yes gene_type:complete
MNIYKHNELGEDLFNIKDWLNDIDAEGATINEMLEVIIKDDNKSADIKNMISFIN